MTREKYIRDLRKQSDELAKRADLLEQNAALPIVGPLAHVVPTTTFEIKLCDDPDCAICSFPNPAAAPPPNPGVPSKQGAPRPLPQPPSYLPDPSAPAQAPPHVTIADHLAAAIRKVLP